MAKLTNYFLTEAELSRALGGGFPDSFIRDYIAGKANSTALLQAIDTNTADIADIFAQLVVLDGRLDAAELDIDTLQADLTAHVGAQSAHGASGNIVGTNNYCTATVGGTVLLADAQANAVASTVAVTSPDAGAAPAAYTQAQMAQVVALVNELKADLTQTVSDLNAAITVINNMLATERTAKQRAL